MIRQIVGRAIAITLCYSATFVYAQRGREPEKKPGNESQGRSSAQRTSEPSGRSQEASGAPGGEWSARTHSGKQSNAAAAVNKNQTPQATCAQGAAAANRNQSQYSGASERRPALRRQIVTNLSILAHKEQPLERQLPITTLPLPLAHREPLRFRMAQLLPIHASRFDALHRSRWAFATMNSMPRS